MAKQRPGSVRDGRFPTCPSAHRSATPKTKTKQGRRVGSRKPGQGQHCLYLVARGWRPVLRSGQALRPDIRVAHLFSWRNKTITILD
jgi:hypothetical protein